MASWVRPWVFLYQIFRDAVFAWINDRAPSMGAAIAYYTIFSLAPMLVIVIGIAASAFGEEAARGAIFAQFRDLIGPEGAAALETMIQNAAIGNAGAVATVVGAATLLIGATTVFAELQASLNVIFKAAPDPASPVTAIVRTRLVSLALILAIGFLLLVSLVVSTLLAAFDRYLASVLPGLDLVLRGVSFALSFAMTAVLFAMIYKVLPDAPVAWRDVWLGAAVTALLFTAGKSLIGLYIGSSQVASAYGAAGALIIILIWVYFSAQILLFGAEVAKAFSDRTAGRTADRPSG